MSNSNYGFMDPEAEGSGQKRNHFVFKEGVFPRFPDSAESARAAFYILPSPVIAEMPGWEGIPLKQQYLPYRDWSDTDSVAAGKLPRFTQWIRVYSVYPWVGGDANIIAPASYHSGTNSKMHNSPDPVRTLIDYIKRDKSNNWMLGLTPDGKQPTSEEQRQQLFQNKILPVREEKRFLVNSVSINTHGEIEPPYLFSLPNGAIVNRGKRDANKKVTSNSWGLFDELNKTLRNVDPAAVAADPAMRFYWGDITSPSKPVMVELFRDSPPTGGSVKLYNMLPVDTKTSMVFSSEMLDKRINLLDDNEMFVDYSPHDVVALLLKVLGQKIPDILVRAFPGYQIKKMLDEVGGEEPHEEEPADDISFAPAPAARPAAASAPAPAAAAPAPAPAAAPARSFAPPPAAAALPKLWWVCADGVNTTDATTAEVQALAGTHGPDMPVMSKQSGSAWSTASALNLMPPPPAPTPAPPVAAPVPPPPPAAPPAPAPQAAVPAPAPAPAPAPSGPAGTSGPPLVGAPVAAPVPAPSAPPASTSSTAVQQPAVSAEMMQQRLRSMGSTPATPPAQVPAPAPAPPAPAAAPAAAPAPPAPPATPPVPPPPAV